MASKRGAVASAFNFKSHHRALYLCRINVIAAEADILPPRYPDLSAGTFTWYLSTVFMNPCSSGLFPVCSARGHNAFQIINILVN